MTAVALTERSHRAAPRWVRYGQGLALAFEFVGTIGTGVFVGWLVDEQLSTGPVFLIIGTLMAVVGGFVRLISMMRRLDRRREGASLPPDGNASGGPGT